MILFNARLTGTRISRIKRNKKTKNIRAIRGAILFLFFLHACLLEQVIVLDKQTKQAYTCTVYCTIKKETTVRIVNFSEARNKLKMILDRVANDADYTIITRRDADDAVVMSLNHLEGLLETVHLLKSPANVAHLAKSIAQYRSSTVQKHSLIND